LDQFFSSIQDQNNLSILDFAGASQANVSFITTLGHRIFSNDILHTLDEAFGGEGDFVANQADPRRADYFLRESLDFSERSFDGALVWREGRSSTLSRDILRPVDDPFDSEGGIRMLTGPLGRAVCKISAVKSENRRIEAPALCFDDQEALLAAFQRGELDRDFVAVVRFQGPRANGMPELHSLTPTLGILLDRGRKVALVTDGRMSGASGKVSSAIHVTPEAAVGGPLAHVRDGDVIRLDPVAGELTIQVDPRELMARPAAQRPAPGFGYGRELFGWARAAASPADAGACTLFA